MTDSDVVRAVFAAYLSQDRGAAERLLADDLVFVRDGRVTEIQVFFGGRVR